MPHVLVVDDQKLMREVIREILGELESLEIDEAADGETALTKMKSTPYDLVISDWNMPRMDGIALLQAIRSTESLKSVPVIMLTGQSEREHVLQAKQFGVSGFVRKPFNPPDLLATVSRILPGQKAA
jgi:two-component system chemotaxis response regulator CheY